MRVHRNLHAARQGKPQWVETLRGKVAGYHASLTLLAVSTRIQPAAAAACERTQVRRVCAFLDGVPHGNKDLPAEGWVPGGYDPRTGRGFTADGTEWTTADAVSLNADGSFHVLNPTRPTATLSLFAGA